MKKLLCGVMAFAITASALSLNSCDDKIVSSENKIDTSKKATLIINTGIVKKAGEKAVAMSGQVTILLSAANNNLGGSGDGSYIQYETLSAEQLTVEVPVLSKGTEYTLIMPEFVAEYNNGSESSQYQYKGTEESSKTTFTLKPGDVQVLKIKYQGTNKVKVE